MVAFVCSATVSFGIPSAISTERIVFGSDWLSASSRNAGSVGPVRENITEMTASSTIEAPTMGNRRACKILKLVSSCSSLPPPDCTLIISSQMGKGNLSGFALSVLCSRSGFLRKAVELIGVIP